MGRVVLITGAGSGVGKDLVDQFHQAGDTIVAVDIAHQRLADLHGRCPDVTCVQADISTDAGARKAVSAAPGPIDVLCNNAGIADKLWADEVSEARWDEVMAVNLKGPFLLTRAVLPAMVDRGSGTIVNVASISGIRGARAGAAYTAAKFGLVGLTQNVAATFGPQGVRCNAVCPGSIDTNIRESIIPSADSSRDKEFYSRDRGKPPAASPEEIATVVLFLASAAASRVNGVVLPVDGGWTAY